MQEKLNILVGILGSCYASGDEHLFRCPYCKHHKRKLSINVEKGVYKCWICDARGKKLSRIVRRFGSFADRESWKEISGEKTNLSDFSNIFEEEVLVETEQVLKLPDSFSSLCNKEKAQAPLSYLKGRGLSAQDILRWKIGYCRSGDYKGRIIIPSFSSTGHLNYFIARTFVKDYRNYLNPPASKDIIFNELYLDFDEELVIVEGIFDALRLENSVPLLGSTLRESSKLFRKIVKHDTSVLLALDPDASQKSLYIKRKLLKYGIEVREVQYPDARDFGEMSREEIHKLTLEAPFVEEYDDILSALANI